MFSFGFVNCIGLHLHVFSASHPRKLPLRHPNPSLLPKCRLLAWDINGLRRQRSLYFLYQGVQECSSPWDRRWHCWTQRQQVRVYIVRLRFSDSFFIVNFLFFILVGHSREKACLWKSVSLPPRPGERRRTLWLMIPAKGKGWVAFFTHPFSVLLIHYNCIF